MSHRVGTEWGSGMRSERGSGASVQEDDKVRPGVLWRRGLMNVRALLAARVAVCVAVRASGVVGAWYN